MTGVNHGRAGLIMAVAIPALYPMEPECAIVCGGMCFIGSLAPDIDSPSSTISKYVPLIPTLLNKMFGHRKLLHSPVFLILFSLGLSALLGKVLPENMRQAIMIGFVAGFALHIFLDMFTAGGSPLFYPFYSKNISLTKRKSGAKGEVFVMLGCCLFLIITTYLYKSGILGAWFEELKNWIQA